MKNPPIGFMDLIYRVFLVYLDNFVIVFVDGIFIYSDNEQEYEEHQRLMVEVLRNNKLYAKFIKCDFLMKEVLFVGHIIFKDGVYQLILHKW